ncbi:MAG: hypothetical protein ACTSRZ_04345 [Promethearchaeota archaeon]
MSSISKLREKFFAHKPNLQKALKKLENLKNSIVFYINDAILEESAKRVYASDFNDVILILISALSDLEKLIYQLSADFDYERYGKIHDKINRFNFSYNKKEPTKELHNSLDYANEKMLQSSSEFELFMSPKQINNFKFAWESLSKETINTIRSFLYEIEEMYGKLEKATDIPGESGKKIDSIEQKEYIPIKKISDRHYQFICSVCGKVATEIKNAQSLLSDDIVWKYFGLMFGRELDEYYYPVIISYLENSDLKGLHEFFKDKVVHEGLDAYCPECNKIYCKRHYSLEIVYDEGFYDYTMGTCPEGHKRIVDD